MSSCDYKTSLFSLSIFLWTGVMNAHSTCTVLLSGTCLSTGAGNKVWKGLWVLKWINIIKAIILINIYDQRYFPSYTKLLLFFDVIGKFTSKPFSFNF